jgi:hypothetical protein
MITAITIENFKGISEPVRLELRPITLLFGQNSSGKSSLLHALIYAREVFERHNLDADRTLSAGEYLDLGGFHTLIHQHDVKRDILLRFELDLSDADLPTYLGPTNLLSKHQHALWNISARAKSATAELTISWSESRQVCYVQRYRTSINSEFAGEIVCDPSRREVVLQINQLHPVWSVHEIPPEDAPLDWKPSDPDSFQVLGQTDALPDWNNCLQLGNPYEGASEVEVDENEAAVGREILDAERTQVIVGPGKLIREILGNFRYIGPLRQIPPRDYSPPRLPEPSRWANGLAGWDLLFRQPALVDRVSRLFVDPQRLNLGYMLELVEFREFESHDRFLAAVLSNTLDDVELDGLLAKALIRRRLLFRPIEAPAVTLEPADLGVGVSQMIPAIAAALDDQPIGSAALPAQLVAVEHPELNLHPRLQAELADVFLEGALSEATTGRIFFIETHSEVLPLRLFRRVRECSRKKSVEAGDGSGDGIGAGHGDGTGDGRGDASGAGYGDGSGDGQGDGSGAGYGDGQGDGQGGGRFEFVVKPTDVGVWYVDRSSGTVTVKRIAVDIEGEFIQPWPEDDTLFEQDFRERYA